MCIGILLPSLSAAGTTRTIVPTHSAATPSHEQKPKPDVALPTPQPVTQVHSKGAPERPAQPLSADAPGTLRTSAALQAL